MLPMIKVSIAVGGMAVLTWAGRKMLIEHGLRMDEDYQRFVALESRKVDDAKIDGASASEVKTLKKKVSKNLSKERKRKIKYMSSSKNMNKILKKLSKEDKQKLLLQHGDRYGFKLKPERKKSKGKGAGATA